jgi:hypothetical protein
MPDGYRRIYGCPARWDRVAINATAANSSAIAMYLLAPKAGPHARLIALSDAAKVKEPEPKRQAVAGQAAAAEKNRERDARLRIIL